MARASSQPDLVQALESGVRVVYVHGDAAILVDAVVDELEAWGVARCGLKAFNHGRWRGSDDRAAEALVTARTVPMMADMRVVVLRDLHHANGSVCEEVVAYMEEPSPSTLFIAVAGTFGKARKGDKNWATRLQNAAKKNGLLIARKAKDVSPVRFAHDHAAGVGLHLGRREADVLVELVGTDLGRLAREVEKLGVFLDARPGEGEPVRVTGEAMQEVCSALAEESVWELTTGIARQDRRLALRALHRLLSDGQEPHYLFAMVCMQLRKVMHGVQLLRRGLPEHAVKKEARLWRELADVQRLARSSADPGHPFHDPATVFERLALANRDMNSAPAGRHRVLEALVVELCTG